jgi:HPt (histidine-containing phosphotransfer) domain-containing protein
MVSLFLLDIPKQSESLRQASEQVDLQAVARLARSFKGSVANFSAELATCAALKLESAARTENRTLVEQAHKELEEAIKQPISALNE